MLKFLATASLFFAFTFGMTAIAVAQAMTPPSPPNTRYKLPNAAAGHPADGFREGRSIYEMGPPGTFYGATTDERGYPTGDPQNPRTGG
jgi:hypothetical protein